MHRNLRLEKAFRVLFCVAKSQTSNKFTEFSHVFFTCFFTCPFHTLFNIIFHIWFMTNSQDFHNHFLHIHRVFTNLYDKFTEFPHVLCFGTSFVTRFVTRSVPRFVTCFVRRIVERVVSCCPRTICWWKASRIVKKTLAEIHFFHSGAPVR